MTHEEEFEQFVGGEDDRDPSDLCRRCNDWPCCCNRDDSESEPDEDIVRESSVPSADQMAAYQRLK